jgi:hypothetical protein
MNHIDTILTVSLTNSHSALTRCNSVNTAVRFRDSVARIVSPLL